ncbi:4877_t:CDS:2, partial [Racocetra persica]
MHTVPASYFTLQQIPATKKIPSLAAQRWSDQPPSKEIKALKNRKEKFTNFQYQPHKKKQDLELQTYCILIHKITTNSQDDSQDVVHDIYIFFTPN